MEKEKKKKAQENISFSSEDYIKSENKENPEEEVMELNPKLKMHFDNAGSVLRMLPAIIFSSIVILIVRTHSYTRPMSQFFWSDLTDNSQIYDIFSYWKAVAIIFCAVLAIVIYLVSDRKKYKVIKNPIYVAMGVYGAGVLLSFELCDYQKFAALGFNERFEGLLPILGYLVMLFYIINMVREEKDLRLILVPLAVSMLLLGVLGFSQSIGKDFFTTLAGQKLVTPFEKYPDGTNSWVRLARLMIEGKPAYTFKFKDNEVYQTVYNLNYVPFYLSLILPLFAMIFIKCFTGEKKTSKRVTGIAALAVYGLCLYNFFCANSASGYFGLAVILILGVIVFRKKIKEWIKPLVAIVLVTAAVMGVLSDRWLPEVSSMIGLAKENAERSLFAYAADENPAEKTFQNAPASKRPQINSILTGENYVTFDINGSRLKALIDGTGMIFLDEDEKPIPAGLIDDGKNYYMFLDDRYHDYIKFGYGLDNNTLTLVFVTAGTPWRFRFHDNEGFKYIAPTSTADFVRETEIGPIESIGFEGNYRFGTNRGYIWARTLPLLKSRILVGSGPDLYCIYFPQNDFAAKYTIQGNVAIITDKPHNMYLLNAVNNGCVAALAYIAMIVLALLDAKKHCCTMKGYAPLAEFVGSGAFLGVAAFAVVGLFNDTCPSTAPMFYTMMGLAVACSRIAEKAEADALMAEKRKKASARTAKEA